MPVTSASAAPPSLHHSRRVNVPSCPQTSPRCSDPYDARTGAPHLLSAVRNRWNRPPCVAFHERACQGPAEWHSLQPVLADYCRASACRGSQESYCRILEGWPCSVTAAGPAAVDYSHLSCMLTRFADQQLTHDCTNIGHGENISVCQTGFR